MDDKSNKAQLQHVLQCSPMYFLIDLMRGPLLMYRVPTRGGQRALIFPLYINKTIHQIQIHSCNLFLSLGVAAQIRHHL